MSFEPCWWNPLNYRCPKVRDVWYPCFPLRKAIFEFRNDDVRPATLQLEPRTFIQPDRHFETDKGSIPVVLRPLLPADSYELEFIFHDSPYQRCDAHGAGYWVSTQLDGKYEWIGFTRPDVDSILRTSMQVATERVWIAEAEQWLTRDRQHATRAMAETVYLAVRAFGPRW